MNRIALFIACISCLAIVGCKNDGGDAGKKAAGKKGGSEPPMTNRIDVSPTVRRNLGITFVKVERRRVASTIRVPGHFELTPNASREYHSTLSGRVELLVEQYDKVSEGTPLYRVDSPQWREMQRKLSESSIAIRRADQRRDAMALRAAAVKKHDERLHDEESVWLNRVKQVEELISAGSGAASELAEAQSQLAATRTRLAEVEEEEAGVKQQVIDLESELAGYRESMPLLYADALGKAVSAKESASPRMDLALTPAAAMLGVSVDELRKNVGSAESPTPYWRTIAQIEFRAAESGVVKSLAVTKGSWIESSALVVTTVDPERVRFRAIGLQADLDRLSDGMPSEIVAPRGASRPLTGSIKGTLTLGLEADPLERKIDLIVVPNGEKLPSWARHGVAAEMEIELDQTSGPQLAIPTSSVIKDGLERVIFRRDPKNPDKVIRLEADLGLSDGRWVVVESGIASSDEVVHHGVYELMLASGSGKEKGGHFHSDGTFHEGED